MRNKRDDSWSVAGGHLADDGLCVPLHGAAPDAALPPLYLPWRLSADSRAILGDGPSDNVRDCALRHSQRIGSGRTHAEPDPCWHKRGGLKPSDNNGALRHCLDLNRCARLIGSAVFHHKWAARPGIRTSHRAASQPQHRDHKGGGWRRCQSAHSQAGTSYGRGFFWRAVSLPSRPSCPDRLNEIWPEEDPSGIAPFHLAVPGVGIGL